MPSRRRNSALLLRSNTQRSHQRSRSATTKLLHRGSKTEEDRQSLSPRLPIELLDYIVESFIAQLSSKPNGQRFASITSLTLTSRIIRQLTLRHFFYDLRLMSREEWSSIFQILTSLSMTPAMGSEIGSFAWVKNLYASSKVLSRNSNRLQRLSHLRTLFIDLAQDGLLTQHPTLANIFSSLAPCITYPNLTSLTLSNLPRIDCLLLRLIAKTFPCLVDLYLSCTERIEFDCCWACFEDSLGCTLHSPVPDDYFDILKMADAFATALKPLEYLEHLHLGVFLSDDSLLLSHISHVMEEDIQQPLLRDWSECRRCFDGTAVEIRRRELEASIIVGQKLKTLKTIGWSSLVAGDTGPIRVEQYLNSDDTVEDIADQSQDEDDDNGEEHITARAKVDEMEDRDMKTTIWILRSKGRIKVRRAPW